MTSGLRIGVLGVGNVLMGDDVGRRPLSFGGKNT